jgi:cell division protein FtsQ
LALWLLVAAAIVAVGAGAFFLSRSSVFHARGVDVTGAAHLARADVVRIAGVSTATNIVWLDEGLVERRLESDPWIAHADVHVALPWTIEIVLTERSPVAVANDGVREILVAGDGTALGLADRTRGLPEISLPSRLALDGSSESPSGAALALGAMSPELRAEVTSVTVQIGGALEMRLRGGISVRYGGAWEPRRKAAVLQRVLAWAQAEGERVASVNVVSPAAPAVKLALG